MKEDLRTVLVVLRRWTAEMAAGVSPSLSSPDAEAIARVLTALLSRKP